MRRFGSLRRAGNPTGFYQLQVNTICCFQAVFYRSHCSTDRLPETLQLQSRKLPAEALRHPFNGNLGLVHAVSSLLRLVERRGRQVNSVLACRLAG